MSVDVFVFLEDKNLPSLRMWQNTLNSMGVDVKFEPDFDPRKDSGYRPVKLDGVDSGFEYSYGSAEKAFGEVPEDVGPRDRVALFILHSNMRELATAMFAAAALVKCADGLLYYEDDDDYVGSERALELAEETKQFAEPYFDSER